MPATASRDIPALTSLRFLAAFYVFLFHIHIRAPLTDQLFFSNIINQGAVGMTIFFMLSGFILAHRYSGRLFSDREFIVARIARIYPAYIVSSILALPMLYFKLEDLRFGVLSAIVQVLLIVVTALSMIQAWIPMMFSYINNNASWSLSVEAFFYLVFLLVISRMSNLSGRQLILLWLLFYCLSLVNPLAYYAFENRPTMGLQIFYAMPIFRVSEFIIGIVTYLLFQRFAILARIAKPVLVMSLTISIAYLGTIASYLPIFVGHNWIMLPLIASLLVVLSDPGSAEVSRFFQSKLSIYLGRISYCFYLFQFHVILVLTYLLPNANEHGFYFGAATLLTLLAAASFFYHFLELPAAAYVRRRLLNKSILTKDIQL